MGLKEQALKYLAGDKYVVQKAVSLQTQSTELNAYLQNVYQWMFNFQPVTIVDKPLEYVNSYMTNPDVYTCIDKISKKLVKTPIIIYEVIPGKEAKYLQYKSLRYSDEPAAQQKAALFKAQSLREVNQKDIERLIYSPNSEQTQTEFFTQLIGFYLITGNGYVYFNGPGMPGKDPWTEMFVLPSPLMEIISGGMFDPIKGYRINFSYLANNSIIPFEKENVTQIRTFNPEFTIGGTQLYGMSALRALLLSLAMSKEGRKELLKQAKNGGTLGLLSPDGQLMMDGPQQKDLKEKLETLRNSDSRGDRLLTAAGSMKFTQLGLPSTELALIEALGVSGEDIYRAYHVPLTFRTLEASTRDNMTLSNKQFIYDAVMPIGDVIEDKILNRSICAPVNKKTGRQYIAEYDYQSLPELQADMKTVSEWLTNSPDLTLNEKREAKGYGRREQPEMDEIFVPSDWRNVKDAAMSDAAFTDAQQP